MAKAVSLSSALAEVSRLRKSGEAMKLKAKKEVEMAAIKAVELAEQGKGVAETVVGFATAAAAGAADAAADWDPTVPQPSEIFGVVVGGLSLLTSNGESVLGVFKEGVQESAKASLHWATGHRAYNAMLSDDEGPTDASVGAEWDDDEDAEDEIDRAVTNDELEQAYDDEDDDDDDEVLDDDEIDEVADELLD